MMKVIQNESMKELLILLIGSCIDEMIFG